MKPLGEYHEGDEVCVKIRDVPPFRGWVESGSVRALLVRVFLPGDVGFPSGPLARVDDPAHVRPRREVCDRCHADDGTVAVFTGCSACGPVLLCASCTRVHREEIKDGEL